MWLSECKFWSVVIFYTSSIGILGVTEFYSFLHHYVCLFLEMNTLLFCGEDSSVVILICLAGVNLSLVLFLLCIYFNRYNR